MSRKGHPENEVRAAEIEVYLYAQGVVLTCEQRQWLEAYFLERPRV